MFETYNAMSHGELGERIVCLSSLSKDLEGELRLIESEPELCRERDCTTLETLHHLELRAARHDCDSDVGALYPNLRETDAPLVRDRRVGAFELGDEVLGGPLPRLLQRASNQGQGPTPVLPTSGAPCAGRGPTRSARRTAAASAASLSSTRARNCSAVPRRYRAATAARDRVTVRLEMGDSVDPLPGQLWQHGEMRFSPASTKVGIRCSSSRRELLSEQ
jgi:hypothetical protein